MTEAPPRRTLRKRVANGLDGLAILAHTFHGTRGLMLGGAGLFVLGLAQPLLPPEMSRLWFVAPVFAVLVIGLTTLPREGVAAQQRARALARHDDAVGRLARSLIWPILLMVFLIPRVFLAAFGVPHLSPLTGLTIPSVQQRITHVLLFTLILIAAAYLRSTSRYASHVIAKRPKDLSREDRSHQERDALLWLGLGLLLAYAFLLRSFWQPFSLVAWPPDLDSLRVGARGVASITFSIAIPLIVFTVITSHAGLLRDLVRKSLWREKPEVFLLAATHVALGITCVAMHAYDLLWIAQYRAWAPF